MRVSPTKLTFHQQALWKAYLALRELNPNVNAHPLSP